MCSVDANEITQEYSSDLVLRLVGPGIDPTAVPFRALSRILGAVQRLVDQKDDEAESATAANHGMPITEEVEDPTRVLHLIGVKTSSAAYQVGTVRRDVLYQVLGEIATSINSPDTSDWLDSTVSSIKELSEVAKALGCNIEFCEPSNGTPGRAITSIDQTTYDRVRNFAFVFGETSVYAKVEDVGGYTARHCHIRLPQSPRKMVVCGVASDDLVRSLGQHIYQNVVLTGKAKWLRHNWKLKRLDITGFTPPKRGSIRDTLDRISGLGGGAWDRIADPDAYITEMRNS